MYKTENSERTATYFSKVLVINLDTAVTSKTNIAVNLDLSNDTYSIYPEEYIKKHEYDKLNVGDNICLDIDSIKNNGYNKFEYKHIEDIEEQVISRELFDNYKYAMQYDLNYAYEMLDKEYREKRFGDFENYKRYIQDNYNDLVKSRVTKYQIVKNDTKEQYVCLDNFGKYYIFTMNNMCNYSLELDTYTIESNEFITKYTERNDKQKAGMNVEKLFEALNTGDYVYIYKHMAESFKNNNYPNMNVFEEYIKQNLFTFVEKEYTNYNFKGNLHIFNLKVMNKENNEQQKEMTVIVRLKEGTEYEMSFSIEKYVYKVIIKVLHNLIKNVEKKRLMIYNIYYKNI